MEGVRFYPHPKTLTVRRAIGIRAGAEYVMPAMRQRRRLARCALGLLIRAGHARLKRVSIETSGKAWAGDWAAATSQSSSRLGYDQIADSYLQQFGHSAVRARKLNELADLLPSRAHVLDLDCGAGVPVVRSDCTRVQGHRRGRLRSANRSRAMQRATSSIHPSRHHNHRVPSLRLRCSNRILFNNAYPARPARYVSEKARPVASLRRIVLGKLWGDGAR